MAGSRKEPGGGVPPEKNRSNTPAGPLGCLTAGGAEGEDGKDSASRNRLEAQVRSLGCQSAGAQVRSLGCHSAGTTGRREGPRKGSG